MSIIDTTIEKAEGEIVFALKKQALGAQIRQSRPESAEQVRQPVVVENRDLESAIDDMLTRFPKTLEYLAK